MTSENQTVVPRHYDLDDVLRLRRDAELHAVDFTRAQISVANGKHTVTFGKPLVAVDKLLGKAPDRFSHSSVLQVEGFMLDNLIRLHRAERQAVRCGVVFGWDSAKICRTPLTDEELSEYRARTTHAATVAKLQEQLSDAVQAQARRAKQVQESMDFAGRYSVATGTDPLMSTDEIDMLISGTPSKPPRRAKSARSL